MAQAQMETQARLTAAERDAQFINEHPIEGRIVQTGAVLTGVGEALDKAVGETGDLVKKTYAPGDQKKILHPLDDLGHGITHLKQGVNALFETGDMKIANAPHPVDHAVHKAADKLEEITQAGAIEGARIGAAATVGPILDTLGPSGKLKTAEKILEGAADAAQVGKAVKHVNDAVTNAFFHEAVQRTEKQLVNAMEEYDKTALAAKTYGTELGRQPGHGDALVKFQIASIRLDQLKHGGDASIKNPEIADLTKNGTASEHFYSINIMNELKQFKLHQSHDYQTVATDIAADATRKAHENRLNYLMKQLEDNKTLTSQQMLEVNIGKSYGPDAAANARELIANGQGVRARELYPEKAVNAEGNVTQPNTDKSGNDRVSFNDAINHLEHPQAKAIVLARIEEQKTQTHQYQAGVELV